MQIIINAYTNLPIDKLVYLQFSNGLGWNNIKYYLNESGRLKAFFSFYFILVIVCVTSIVCYGTKNYRNNLSNIARGF